jgi:tRNA (mo5U34)-methyltransferase
MATRPGDLHGAEAGVDYPAATMERAELQERIAAFPRWHYQFEFDGGVHTPVSHRGQRNRHEQRRRYFFDPLVRALGGSLAGHRVLDLGCNAGFWSLAALECRADFVLGVDARQSFIDQAELVFAAKGADPARYRFEQGNIFEHEIGEQFDLVLCLGVMEVTCKPVELFELMRGAGAETILLDTVISRARSSFFELSKLTEPRAAVDYEIALIPSRAAVSELAASFGYEALPLAYNITDWAGLDDYRRSQRLAFICSKGPPLAGLARAPEDASASWRSRLTALAHR